ncbi:MAG TPA: hypothetical protein VN969_04065 [Streptosporangiaceae bacterium]|nr:hypothetical protein [Streptosporangiaceae bacterium]
MDAEIYVRRLAEAEIRRSGTLTRSDVNAGMARIHQAALTLRAAGVLTEGSLQSVTAGLTAALAVRSDLSPGLIASRMQQIGPPRDDQDRPAATYPQAHPLGQRIRVASERAPADLHLLSLVRSPHGTVITIAMIMRWPADGSSADLEITGAGPVHLPYERLEAVDSEGARYRVTFQLGEGGSAAWRGSAALSAPLPQRAQWVDIIADGTERLVRLDLTRPAVVAEVTADEQAAAPGERLLAIAAERILASACGAAEPIGSMDLGNMIEVLTGAGAVAPDSPAIGRLAALCDRLGITSHGIPAPAAADIPAPWSSVLERASAALHAAGEYAPLGMVLPLVDGNRFVLAGLSVAGGDSFLLVVASGPLAPPPISWWVRDSAGDWHVAVPRYPEPHGTEPVLRLQLVPPLDLAGDTIEVVVTGTTGRVRAVCHLR